MENTIGRKGYLSSRDLVENMAGKLLLYKSPCLKYKEQIEKKVR